MNMFPLESLEVYGTQNDFHNTKILLILFILYYYQTVPLFQNLDWSMRQICQRHEHVIWMVIWCSFLLVFCQPLSWHYPVTCQICHFAEMVSLPKLFSQGERVAMIMVSKHKFMTSWCLHQYLLQCIKIRIWPDWFNY